MELVFVYGTLRRGFHNHRLLQHAECLGEAQTVEAYVLRSRAGGIPFVGRDLALSSIHGELFRIDERTLAQLDRLEGYRPEAHESSWYQRERIEVRCNGQRHTAWIYFNSDVTQPIVPHGDWARA